MDTMLNLKLDADLVETLKRTTAEQGITVEQVIGELARKYIADARKRIIDQEYEQYIKLHAELKEKYLGQNVAIHEGQLVDHDPDAMTLARRVHQKYGRAPILITQVHDKPVREFMIRSPRLVKSE